MYLDKIIAHNKKRKDKETELIRIREENARLWELVDNAHLKFHELMMFSFGAMESCKQRGDKNGIIVHERLIEMGKTAAKDLYVFMDEHHPISSESTND